MDVPRHSLALLCVALLALAAACSNPADATTEPDDAANLTGGAPFVKCSTTLTDGGDTWTYQTSEFSENSDTVTLTVSRNATPFPAVTMQSIGGGRYLDDPTVSRKSGTDVRASWKIMLGYRPPSQSVPGGVPSGIWINHRAVREDAFTSEEQSRCTVAAVQVKPCEAGRVFKCNAGGCACTVAMPEPPKAAQALRCASRVTRGQDLWTYETSPFSASSPTLRMTVSKNGTSFPDLLLARAADGTFRDGNFQRRDYRVRVQVVGQSIAIHHLSAFGDTPTASVPPSSGSCELISATGTEGDREAVARGTRCVSGRQVNACDSLGCRCVDIGTAPADEGSQFVIDSVISLGVGGELAAGINWAAAASQRGFAAIGDLVLRALAQFASPAALVRAVVTSGRVELPRIFGEGTVGAAARGKIPADELGQLMRSVFARFSTSSEARASAAVVRECIDEAPIHLAYYEGEVLQAAGGLLPDGNAYSLDMMSAVKGGAARIVQAAFARAKADGRLLRVSPVNAALDQYYAEMLPKALAGTGARIERAVQFAGTEDETIVFIITP